jgi:hypothetical protein
MRDPYLQQAFDTIEAQVELMRQAAINGKPCPPVPVTNQELAAIIADRMDQIIILTGLDGDWCLCRDIESVVMNGDHIQINTAEIVQQTPDG